MNVKICCNKNVKDEKKNREEKSGYFFFHLKLSVAQETDALNIVL